MRALCLLLIVCGACMKKPAAKAAAPTPPADATPAPSPGAPPPPTQTMERKGDPCSGGEKPH
jgi:hypothetical protein